MSAIHEQQLIPRMRRLIDEIVRRVENLTKENEGLQFTIESQQRHINTLEAVGTSESSLVIELRKEVNTVKHGNVRIRTELTKTKSLNDRYHNDLVALRAESDALRMELLEIKSKAADQIDCRQYYTCHMEKLRQEYIREQMRKYNDMHLEMTDRFPGPSLLKVFRQEIEEKLNDSAL